MIVLDNQDNEIEITISGQYRDDIQIESAYYTDSDTEVSEETIEYIYKHYASDLYETWLEQRIGYAEAYYEQDR